MNINNQLLEDFHTATLLDIYFFMFVLMLLGFASGIFFVWWLERKEKTYKQGQIDAINGEIHYELKKTKYGESRWCEITHNKKTK